MDVVSLGFLVLIVAIGAVIALIADNLGRTLGKKRLKFLHLRPRHTAMLFTALAGLAIPLITVLLVATVSSDVRQWILEGRKAIADVRRLESQRSELQKEVRAQTDLVEKLENAQRDSQKRASELDKLNKDLERQLPQLKEQVQSARARLGDAQTTLGNARRRLDATLRNLRASESNLKDAKSGLSLTRSTFAAAAAQLRDVQTEMAQLDQQLQNSEREVSNLQSERSRLQSQIETSRTEFQREQEENERELGQLRRDLASTRQQISDTQDELRGLQLSVAALQGVNENSRTKSMIFALGDEVARIVIPPNQPNSGARNQLARLLRTARLAAEARGAKGSPAAGLFGQERSPEEEAAAIIATIGGLPDSRVLIAYSRVNTFVGEPVALRVEMRPYKLAFAADEVVAEVRIDGDSKPSEVLQALSAFLSGPLRDQALTRGMVPVEGADAPLGTIDPGTLLNLVFEIVAQNRTARVQALADQEIFTGDELKLRFRIR